MALNFTHLFLHAPLVLATQDRKSWNWLKTFFATMALSELKDVCSLSDFRESEYATAVSRPIDSATADQTSSPLPSPARRRHRQKPRSPDAHVGNVRLAEPRCHRRSTILRASDM